MCASPVDSAFSTPKAHPLHLSWPPASLLDQSSSVPKVPGHPALLFPRLSSPQQPPEGGSEHMGQSAGHLHSPSSPEPPGAPKSAQSGSARLGPTAPEALYDLPGPLPPFTLLQPRQADLPQGLCTDFPQQGLCSDPVASPISTIVLPLQPLPPLPPAHLPPPRGGGLQLPDSVSFPRAREAPGTPWR